MQLSAHSIHHQPRKQLEAKRQKYHHYPRRLSYSQVKVSARKSGKPPFLWPEGLRPTQMAQSLKGRAFSSAGWKTIPTRTKSPSLAHHHQRASRVTFRQRRYQLRRKHRQYRTNGNASAQSTWIFSVCPVCLPLLRVITGGNSLLGHLPVSDHQ